MNFPAIDLHDPTPWTPPALREVEGAPTFLLRRPNRGERDLAYALTAAGLRFHGAAAHRAEAEKALRVLWPAELVDDGLVRVRSFWAALDRREQLSTDDQAALDDLSERLRTTWPRLATMAADDAEFLSLAPKVAAALVVAGWSTLDVPYEREASQVPIATMIAVGKALADVERAAGLEPGVAFAELAAEAFRLINADADAPAPSTPPAPPAPSPDRPARARRNKGTAK